MGKYVLIVICLIFGLGGGWLILYSQGDLKNAVSHYVTNNEFQTLEARYSPQQIMETHYRDLLGDDNHHYLEPSYKYHPYILMEVKFLTDKKTREEVILWSLVNGEMVLNTDTWEQTHGFEDAINVKASHDDFKIINALARSNGFKTKEELIAELQMDAAAINPWIESAIDKHLITRKGNILQLHFENPKILVTPYTKFNRMLVTKPYQYSQLVPQKYSLSQIEKIVTAAFGSMHIGNVTQVYLPIYGINVENPDGSITTTYWNAVNGQMISPKYFKKS